MFLHEAEWILCLALRCHQIHPRSWRKHANKRNKGRHKADTLPTTILRPLPDAISSAPNLCRRYCLCARKQGLSALPKLPDRGTGSERQLDSSRSTGAGRDQRAGGHYPDLRCSHALHRGQAASSRIERIAHYVSAIPRKQSQSDLHRRFP